jgi:hypothetical protein
MDHVADAEVAVTRRSLHLAAEHLVAATRKRVTGEITLEPAPRGVRTPVLPDGRVVSTDGDEFVVRGPEGEQRARLTTLAEAASAVGVEPGFPWSKHPPGTDYRPDGALTVDSAVAAELAEWFRLGQEALAALVAEVPDEEPTAPAIFPEHFDLGVTAGRVNYGFSPGDDTSAAPYAYVGPHVTPPTDAFWNAPFGAYRTWHEVATAQDALAFFHDARGVLARHA